MRVIFTNKLYKRRRKMQNNNKPFQIDKKLIYQAWLTVKSNHGAAGVDKLDIYAVEKDYKNLLYKLWNRMSSGSYMATSIRKVEVPKNDGKGGVRILGIPTVLDRIAQTAVVKLLEPRLDPKFDQDSYGYRPGKSAHDALAQARSRCLKIPYVIDLDIRGFFDNIPHDKLMEIVEKEVAEVWAKMYITRWMKASMQDSKGNITERTKGLSQGGAISPLLANVYLDVVFDKWMRVNFPDVSFERYSDDIITHCSSLRRAEYILERIKERMVEYGLEIHPDKTKIVYCRQEERRERQPEGVGNKFDFLGYCFRTRTSINKLKNQRTDSFTPAISDKSKRKIKDRIREMKIYNYTSFSAKEIADILKSKIVGWINYYGKFRRSELCGVFNVLDNAIIKWIKKKYKLTGVKKAYQKFQELRDAKVFAHFTLLAQMGKALGRAV
jgi:RNA-directed DNA polymerase